MKRPPSACGTVILAAGDFPKRGGRAWRILAAAKRVIACDSAGDAYRRRFRKWPDLTIGDLDSFKGGGSVLLVEDQETNDLSKAIAWCRAQGWDDLVVVGATGKREDHTIGNVYRALAAQVPVVTDHGTFHPVCGKATFRAPADTGVSVFAPDPETRMTSRGLKWKLDGVRFENAWCATLNRTSSATFAVTSTRPVFVFVAET